MSKANPWANVGLTNTLLYIYNYHFFCHHTMYTEEIGGWDFPSLFSNRSNSNITLTLSSIIKRNGGLSATGNPSLILPCSWAKGLVLIWDVGYLIEMEPDVQQSSLLTSSPLTSCSSRDQYSLPESPVYEDCAQGKSWCTGVWSIFTKGRHSKGEFVQQGNESRASNPWIWSLGYIRVVWIKPGVMWYRGACRLRLRLSEFGGLYGMMFGYY